MREGCSSFSLAFDRFNTGIALAKRFFWGIVLTYQNILSLPYLMCGFVGGACRASEYVRLNEELVSIPIHLSSN